MEVIGKSMFFTWIRLISEKETIKIPRLFLMFALSFLCGCATVAQQSGISPDHPDYVLVDIISRPLAKKGSIVPQNNKLDRF